MVLRDVDRHVRVEVLGVPDAKLGRRKREGADVAGTRLCITVESQASLPLILHPIRQCPNLYVSPTGIPLPNDRAGQRWLGPGFPD